MVPARAVPMVPAAPISTAAPPTYPGIEPIDYDIVLNCFTSNGLTALSHHNGLTPEENRRLFTTPHIAEMIYRVLKGLNGCVQLAD